MDDFHFLAVLGTGAFGKVNSQTHTNLIARSHTKHTLTQTNRQRDTHIYIHLSTHVQKNVIFDKINYFLGVEAGGRLDNCGGQIERCKYTLLSIHPTKASILKMHSHYGNFGMFYRYFWLSFATPSIIMQ